MKIFELIDPKTNVTLSSPNKGQQIIININDMKFQVVLQHTNIYWGILPNTGTKKKIDQYRENNRSGIMKILIPALKRAIKILLEKYKPDNVTIESTTLKGRKIYRKWKRIHPLYNGEDTNMGILLIKNV